jgi:hypothetical protein
LKNNLSWVTNQGSNSVTSNGPIIGVHSVKFGL